MDDQFDSSKYTTKVITMKDGSRHKLIFIYTPSTLKPEISACLAGRQACSFSADRR